MTRARKVLDWDKQLSLTIDPELARKKRGARNKIGETACSMCGDYCAVKIVGKYFDSPVFPCVD